MQEDNWEFAMTVSMKDDLTNTNTLKEANLEDHLEFNGACPGCGETPYIKLLTQLFGERMMISMLLDAHPYGGFCTLHRLYYKLERKGSGRINPLFEDAAEFGYGMALGVEQARKRLAELITEA